jgi:hypothetical protein
MRSKAWLVLSIASFVLALFATLPIVTVAGSVLVPPPWDAHLVRVALWPIVWGGLAIVGVWLGARRLLAAAPPPPTAGALAAAALGVAAWHHVELHHWARAHLGYYDADMIGLTAGLFAVLVGIGVAAFASHLAPRGVRWAPDALVLGGALGTAVIAAGNAIAGVPDGIAADSIPLATSIGVAVAYAGIASAVVLRRAIERRGRPG